MAINVTKWKQLYSNLLMNPATPCLMATHIMYALIFICYCIHSLFAQLKEDLCKFVPQWSTSFAPRCAGVDCTFEKVYDSMLKKFPDSAQAAKQFLAFAKSPKDSFPAAGLSSSLPWREVVPNQLQNFINTMAATPASTVQFQVNVDRNVPITFQHSMLFCNSFFFANF